ncbi:hypothetical protein FJZ31_40315 [Candidatus Poribacteria bacterium]|nr:hypothetical protein [Candidatus Poribacteria bacterium]
MAKYFIRMQYAFNKATLEAGKITLQRKDTIVPRRGYQPVNPLPKGINGGYIDRFNKEWLKPRGQIVGEFHWDVQLSPVGQQQLGWASRTGKYINVSQDGRIVH